jgi:hypothetical protein
MRTSVIAALALLVTATNLVAATAFAGCDHPYFPAAKGEKYVYRTSGIDVTEVVTGIEGETVSFEVTTGTGTTAHKSNVLETCNAEGITATAAHTGNGTELKTIKHSGADFGPAAQMKVGGTWTFQDTTELVRNGLTVTTDKKSTSKVVASEKIKVPAGEYETLKIETEIDQTLTMSGKGADKIPKSPPSHYKAESWIAKGVGLVKKQSISASGDASPASELVSFSK